MKLLTLGTDAEVFVKNKNGEICSSIGVLPGDKENPYPTPNGAVQKDNVLAEFNSHPAKNRQQFVDNVSFALMDLDTMLDEKGQYTYAIKASHMMHDKWLDTIEAHEFGCDPDFNVYALDTVHQINTGMAGNLRTAAAHVHMGFTSVSPETQMNVVKTSDVFLGLCSVAIDKDKHRRKLYGQAGHFRPKKYGIEYRVLSNFWLTSPWYMRWVWDASRLAVKQGFTGSYLLGEIENREDEIQEAINNVDAKLAKNLVDDFGLRMLNPKLTPEAAYNDYMEADMANI